MGLNECVCLTGCALCGGQLTTPPSPDDRNIVPDLWSGKMLADLQAAREFWANHFGPSEPVKITWRRRLRWKMESARRTVAEWISPDEPNYD